MGWSNELKIFRNDFETLINYVCYTDKSNSKLPVLKSFETLQCQNVIESPYITSKNNMLAISKVSLSSSDSDYEEERQTRVRQAFDPLFPDVDDLFKSQDEGEKSSSSENFDEGGSLDDDYLNIHNFIS